MKVRFVLSLLLTLTLCSMGVSGQEAVSGNFPIDKDTQLITYQEVVQEPGTADELYVRCIEWINTYYKNPADVCKIRNRESQVIEILYRIELFNYDGEAKLNAGTVTYLLKLEFKPGRYRYTVTDLTLRQASRFPIERWFDKSDKMYSPLWDGYLTQVDTNVKQLIESLKTGMAPVQVKQEEKW